MRGYLLFSLSSVRNHLGLATTLQAQKTSGAQMCLPFPGQENVCTIFKTCWFSKYFKIFCREQGRSWGAELERTSLRKGLKQIPFPLSVSNVCRFRGSKASTPGSACIRAHLVAGWARGHSGVSGAHKVGIWDSQGTDYSWILDYDETRVLSPRYEMRRVSRPLYPKTH